MNEVVNSNDNINISNFLSDVNKKNINLKINEYDIIYKNYSRLTNIYNSLVEYNFDNLSIMKEIYNYENLLSNKTNKIERAKIIKKISNLKNKTNYLLVDYDYNKYLLGIKNIKEMSGKRSIIKFLEIMYYKKEINKKLHKLSKKYKSLKVVENILMELYLKKINN